MAQVPIWLSGVLVVVSFGTLAWLEVTRPLRSQTQSKFRRDVRNLAIAILSAGTIYVAERPIAVRLAQLVEQRQWGILHYGTLPLWVEIPVAVILLDYTLFIWHVLTHKVRLLWRFHEAHHVDLDMDASTALRFHFGEMVLSVPWRTAQIVVIGTSTLALSVWQTATLVAILFHHSNIEIPPAIERWLCRVIVTPRMHGIHHSTVRRETDSNWSTILSFPDRLHRTLRLNVPQRDVVIGVPAFRDPADLTFWGVVTLPFRRHMPTWEAPDLEELRTKQLTPPRMERQAVAVPRTTLLP